MVALNAIQNTPQIIFAAAQVARNIAMGVGKAMADRRQTAEFAIAAPVLQTFQNISDRFIGLIGLQQLFLADGLVLDLGLAEDHIDDLLLEDRRTD